MAIWKLEPIDPNDDHWRASAYCGPVFARAPDEAGARHLAVGAFGIAAGGLAGAKAPRLPWLYAWLVTCERLEESDFDEEGPDAILGPEEALARVHPSLIENS